MSKVTTKTDVRLSYTNLLVPRVQNEGEPPTFGTAILIPKSDTETITAIKAGGSFFARTRSRLTSSGLRRPAR